MGGGISNAFRVALCKRIFKKCGRIRTINRKANFGSGRNLEIGDESGLGARVVIPSDTIIGNHVMIANDVYILHNNHRFDRIDIPINDQGFKPNLQTIIEDDCWIGTKVVFTPGRHVSKGSIVAIAAVLTKDFPAYSIVGGNPAKLIKSRI